MSPPDHNQRAGRRAPDLRASAAGRVRGLALLLAFLLVASARAEACGDDAVARVISTQGLVSAGNRPLQAGDVLCAGDLVTAAANSRAVLRLAPGNAMFHLDADTVLQLRGAASPPSVGLLRGALNALFRQPGELDIDTPVLNASIKGTEYLVRAAADGTSSVAVFDGTVQVRGRGGPGGARGEVAVAAGQRIAAKAGDTLAAGALTVAVAADELSWSVYFPPVVDAHAPPPVQAAATALAHGDVPTAEALLQSPALADDAAALAVRAVAAVVRNEREAARELATRALARGPANASAYLAMSYAQQATLDVAAALASLQACARREDCDAAQPLFQARLIELELANGDTRRALRHCAAPVDKTRAMACGFAQLANGRSALARDLLTQAVAAQPGNPLARLGLGLARLRGNDVSGGREDIETAMLLDPLQSVVRSYLGKAYFEERGCAEGLRGKDCGWASTRPLELALGQYAIARRLDPNDPTPDLYAAIAKQSYNRPIEALADLQRSIAKNDNRAVYRSSLLLDRDEASRAASLAQLYRGLGFDQLALTEGYRALATDPANFAAHRFLAEAFAGQPRHELARVSEVLQTQLLQPISAAPLPAQLGERAQTRQARELDRRLNEIRNSSAGPVAPDLMALSTEGPAALSFNEFNAAFLRNGLSARVDISGGTDANFGQRLGVALVQDRYAVNLDYAGQAGDGIYRNTDDDRRRYGVLGRWQAPSDTLLLGEFRHAARDAGDLFGLVDRGAGINATQRNALGSDQYRFGFQQPLSPASTLIGHFTARDERFETRAGAVDSLALSLDERTRQAELQHLWAPRPWLHSSVGGMWADLRQTFASEGNIPQAPPGVLPAGGRSSGRLEYGNVYLYQTLNPLPPLTLMLGLAAQRLVTPDLILTPIEPRLGLVLRLTPHTTLRAARIENLQNPLGAGQVLEPTQLAGFSRFEDEANVGEGSTRIGVGLEHRLLPALRVGVEAQQIDRLIRNFEPGVYALRGTPQPWEEIRVRGFAYWTLTERLSLGLEGEHQRNLAADGCSACAAEAGFARLNTRTLRASVGYQHPVGLTLSLNAAAVAQRARLLPPAPAVRDRASVLADLSLSYRLPERRGFLWLSARNLFDERIDFRPTDFRAEDPLRDTGVVLGASFYFQ